MSKYLVIFFLLIPLCSQAKLIEHQYKVGEDVYKLKYKIKEVTTTGGIKDLVLFSVYINDRFIHSELEDGGRFFSCRYKQPSVVPVKSLKSQFGWLLTGGGICGNTFSYNALLIIPRNSYSSSYYSKEFLSKELPLIVSEPDGSKVLYSEQNWGKHGTSLSFYVPKKLVLNLNDDFFQIKKGNVLEDVDIFNGMNMIGFHGYFVAGIQDANPALMQYALDNYYFETKDFKSWVENHFEKGDKPYLKGLIEKVKSANELLKETQSIVSSIGGP